MTTTHAPLDNHLAATYNELVLSDDQFAADHFDYLLRTLILGFPHHRITQIKMLRAAAISFGASMGLQEAKQTLDTMTSRMMAERYRQVLASQPGTGVYERAMTDINKMTN
jgi:hypothetical protein